MSDEIDFDKMAKGAAKLQHEITQLIISNEPSKELSTGLIIALANLLVMVTVTVVQNNDKATDIIVAAISRAMREVDKRKKGGEFVIYEVSLDPEAPGEQTKV